MFLYFVNLSIEDNVRVIYTRISQLIRNALDKSFLIAVVLDQFTNYTTMRGIINFVSM